MQEQLSICYPANTNGGGEILDYLKTNVKEFTSEMVGNLGTVIRITFFNIDDLRLFKLQFGDKIEETSWNSTKGWYYAKISNN